MRKSKKRLREKKDKSNYLIYVLAAILILIILFIINFLPKKILPSPETGLLSYWKFDDNVLDSVGRSNGTNAGAAFVSGKVNQSLSFDGTNDYVDFGKNSAITGKTAFTVSAWIKTTKTNGVIIQQRSSSGYNGEYVFLVNAEGKLKWFSYGDNADGFNFVSVKKVNDSNWHHVVGVRETGGTGRIYIDGILDSSKTAPSRNLISLNVYVGADMRDKVSYFSGLIDEVKIWNRALNSSDVKQEYLSVTCGDNFKDIGEVCDGTNLAEKTCVTQGFRRGNLACLADCSGFDVSNCNNCSNNIIEQGEVCDGTNLDDKTCVTQEFRRGNLACSQDCKSFDVSNCNNCGNNITDVGEECDGTDLADKTCASLGFDAGNLSCLGDCSNFNTAQCYNVTGPFRIEVLSPINNKAYNIKNITFELIGNTSLNFCKLSINNWQTNYSMNKINASFFNYTLRNLNDSSYTSRFLCVDLKSAEEREEVSFSIDTINPTIKLNSPADNADLDIGVITFSFNVSDASNIQKCSLITGEDNEREKNESITKNAKNSISASFIFAKDYEWHIRCIDNAENIANSESRDISFSCPSGKEECSDDSCKTDCQAGVGGTPCRDTCSSLRYECDVWSICGNQTDCGSCLSSERCYEGRCVPVSITTTPPENVTGGTGGATGDEEEAEWLWWVILILVILAIIVVIIIIFILKKRGSLGKTFQSTSQSKPFKPPVPPVSPASQFVQRQGMPQRPFVSRPSF